MRAFNTKVVLDDVFGQISSFVSDEKTNEEETAAFVEKLIKQVMSTSATREEKIKMVSTTVAHYVTMVENKHTEKKGLWRGLITWLLARGN